MKRQTTDWEEMFIIHVSDKRHPPKLHKKLPQLGRVLRLTSVVSAHCGAKAEGSPEARSWTPA